MGNGTEIKERLKEKWPTIMLIVLGVALLLAIVTIASLLKLIFSM